MKDKLFYGNYLGIVVANNDPAKRGRVKIFIPHLSPSVYKNWTQIAEDKKFKFIGKNIQSDLTDIVEELKNILPWAECANPLASENATGRYNSHNQTATISDSNCFTTSQPVQNFQPTPYSQNTDGVGEKPANVFEKYNFSLKDAFVTPGYNGVNNANLYGNNYRPSSYSNKAKGTFVVPSVGSHLWVFFIEGNPMYPVYFAASHGTEEWQSAYEITDYPDSYENEPPSNDKTDHNVEIYRNKYLLNQKGGTLEIVNTDNRESIKLTHYSGSFIQFSNPATIYLATANEQHLILGDKFETIRGTDNYYVDGDKDIVIRGDNYKKIGSLNADATQKWKDIMQAVADVKQLFEIQRVSEKTLFNSTQQTKSNNNAKCPVCSRNRGYSSQSNAIGTIESSVPIVNQSTDDVRDYTFVTPKGVFSPGLRSRSFPTTPNCPACGGSGYSPSSMEGEFQAEPLKKQLNQLIASKIVELSKYEAELGLGGHEVIDITKHKIETIGTVMNDFGSIRVDTKGKMYNSSVLVDAFGVYEQQEASPLIEYVHVDDLPGGNYTLNVCNRYTLQVGAGGISIKSFGPVQIGGTITNIAGEQINISSSNEINIDGGKRLTLTSDILVLKQRFMKQVMVDSSLGISRNLIVGGGAHIEGELTINHITAPVEVQETEQVKLYGRMVENAKIGYGKTQSGVAIGTVVLTCQGCAGTYTVYGNGGTNVELYGSRVAPFGEENSVENYTHSHHFRNLPLTLVSNNDDVRSAGKNNNNTDRNTANPQNDSKKGP